MPKCTAPLLSESAVGPIGGLLYRSGTYGQIISRTSSSPALRTPAQSAHRGALRRAYDSWMSLTDEQRDSWNAARSGTKSALNAYTAAHVRISHAGNLPSSQYQTTPGSFSFRNPTAEFYTTNPDGSASCVVYWDPAGTAEALMNIYVLSCFSNRATPKPSKLIYRTSALLSDAGALFAIPFLGTTTWVRLELVDPLAGSVTQTALVRLTMPGDPGFGAVIWKPAPTI